ncbi:hypothetical protein ABT373_33185 [Streptomyces sp. NPDC000070]|uniref:hypothetical protein n=1 Tax=Streptomyces sp. NPDC000070 TaxID=3154240 RepID=UPI003316AF54
MFEFRVGIGTGSGPEGRCGIGTGLVVDVQVGCGSPLAVAAGRTVDGVRTDSAEVAGRG